MSAAELKNIVKKKIDVIEDVELLEGILDLIKNIENDKIFELTAEQEKAIKEGLKDINTGNVLSNKEANKEIDEWLGN